MRISLLLALAAAGCAAPSDSGVSTPTIEVGSDLRPCLGRSVLARGWILELHQKGLPHLYDRPDRNANFLILSVDDSRLESFLRRQVEVKGRILDLGAPPSADGRPQQGYEAGTLGITVESIRGLP